jgi:hypothetical protein
MPTNLDGWKERFRELIEDARCTPMTYDDREKLIALVQQEAELIYFTPCPEPSTADCGPEGAWWD